jgi:hypothetical protein
MGISIAALYDKPVLATLILIAVHTAFLTYIIKYSPYDGALLSAQNKINEVLMLFLVIPLPSDLLLLNLLK